MKDQKHDEIFVGNIESAILPEHVKCLPTARVGDQAYDIHGKKLPPTQHRPLYVGRQDFAAYDRIMMDRFNDATNKWRHD